MREHILIVDHHTDSGHALANVLKNKGFETSHVPSANDALSALRDVEYDAVLLSLSGMTVSTPKTTQEKSTGGLDQFALHLLLANTQTPILLMASANHEEREASSLASRLAPEITKQIYGFLTSQQHIDEIVFQLKRACRYKRVLDEVRVLRKNQRTPALTVDKSASSHRMQHVWDKINHAADGSASFLLLGPVGSGKSFCAREIHDASPRKYGPYVVIQCTNDDAALEAALLGLHSPPDTIQIQDDETASTMGKTLHKHAKSGAMTLAYGGTLVLENIDQLSAPLQDKLLQKLREQFVNGLSATALHDVRIVATSKKTLEQWENDVNQGLFIEELYYRISVVKISLPSLRERVAEICSLAMQFLQKFAAKYQKQIDGFETTLLEKMLSYAWPHNIRELEQSIEKGVLHCRGNILLNDDMPENIRMYRAAQPVWDDDQQELISLDELEQRYIARVLESVGGNKTRAAQVLGLDRKTLYRKLARNQDETTTENSVGALASVIDSEGNQAGKNERKSNVLEMRLPSSAGEYSP